MSILFMFTAGNGRTTTRIVISWDPKVTIAPRGTVLGARCYFRFEGSIVDVVDIRKNTTIHLGFKLICHGHRGVVGNDEQKKKGTHRKQKEEYL